MATLPRFSGGFPRFLKWAGLTIILLAAISALLFKFWLPGFLQEKISGVLSDKLQRPVSVLALEIHPFDLALSLRGFAIGQRAEDAARLSHEGGGNAGPLLAFDQLSLDISGASLLERAPVIESLRLSAPQFHLIRYADGRWNISDILDELAKPAENTPAKEPAVLPRFALKYIEMTGGQLIFDDRLKLARQELTELSFVLPSLDHLDMDTPHWAEPFFHAKVNGAALDFKGRVLPFAQRKEAVFELKLNGFDLRWLDGYVALPPGLRLRSAFLDADLKLEFSQAAGEAFALTAKGETALRKLSIDNASGARPYTLAAERFLLKLTDVDASLKRPLQAAAVLDQFSLRAQADKKPLLTLPKLAINGVRVQVPTQQIALAEVRVEGLNVVLRREADGRLDLLKLFDPKSSAPSPPKVLQKNTPTAAERPWQGKLDQVIFQEGALHFSDLTQAKLPPLAVQAFNLHLDNIDLRGEQPLSIKLAAEINQRGRLALEGKAAWAPVNADLALDLRDIDIVPLQGWAGDRLNALISRGALSVQGQLQASGTPLSVRFNGNGKLLGFNVFDRINNADILSFRAIELDDIKFSSSALKIELKRLLLDDLFARTILGADGKLNLSALVKSSPEGGANEAQTAPITEPATEKKTPPPIKIAEIVFKNSRIDFTDRFIKPSYNVNLSKLEGRIAPISAGQRGQIDLHALVDKAAPLVVNGQVDPFAESLFLKLAARVKGVDLPSLSPYSEKHVGYELAKGKLSLDLAYHVENAQLKAENKLFLDQLTFGNKVNSPDAISAPVSLAVALLKNAKGEIDIDLPITGTLNDPEFSVGKIILKVLGNLMVKAVSSPFKLLGSLFAEDEEISEVHFVAGRSALEPAGEKRLQGLAKALLDRPALTLEVTAHADPEADRSALAEALLERKLKTKKIAETVAKGIESEALRDVILSNEERSRYLTLLGTEEKIELPKGEPEPVNAYRRALLANMVVGDDELKQLAERRGRSVRTWLVDRGQVPIERVFLMVPKLDQADGKDVPARAVFSLR